jgi:hypothetical protein
MRLPGQLGAATLGDVLGMLHRERTSGSLELVEQRGVTSGQVHRIELDCGLVGEVHTSRRTQRLGEILREHGVLRDEAVERLSLCVPFAPSRRIGAILLDDVGVDTRVLRAALRHQLRLKLDAVYGIPDALIRFRVPRPRPRDETAPLPLGPREFLYGRPRARDVLRASGAGRPHAASDADVRRRNALSLLGLPEHAGLGEVRRAFRRLAAERHPDRFPHEPPSAKAELMRRFAELTAAYHTLVP